MGGVAEEGAFDQTLRRDTLHCMNIAIEERAWLRLQKGKVDSWNPVLLINEKLYTLLQCNESFAMNMILPLLNITLVVL